MSPQTKCIYILMCFSHHDISLVATSSCVYFNSSEVWRIALRPLDGESPSSGIWLFFFSEGFFFCFFLGFEVKREERERKEFVSGVADIIPKILPAAPPWTVWQTCPWPPTLSAEDNGPSESSRCVWAKPKRARARAGNGQEGIGMSDREAQCEWWWWCWWEKEKKKGNLRRESEELLGFRFNSAGSFFSLCAETGPAH